MLIQLIQGQVEKSFIDALGEWQNNSVNRAVLLCAFSKTQLRADSDSILSILKNIIHDYHGELYFCADGDIAVCWRGRATEIKTAIINAFLTNYHMELELCPSDKLFHFFDANVQGEDLRLLFHDKLNKIQKQAEELKPETSPVKPEEPIIIWKASFSEEQQKLLRNAIIDKRHRKKIELLIVEDQDFSRKLLVGLFEQHYRCYAAKDAKQAVQFYAEHAPDITFLDIELPDADGHTLAALFKKYDPSGCIVMVTGNSHIKDVEMAKANKVQGFIVKPYNKQKIMGMVDAYISTKKG